MTVQQLELIPTNPIEPESLSFDWKRDEADIVLEEQPRTAVYENTSGAVVILQEATSAYDEDQIIRVRPENLPALIKALQRYLP